MTLSRGFKLLTMYDDDPCEKGDRITLRRNENGKGKPGQNPPLDFTYVRIPADTTVAGESSNDDSIPF